MTLTTGRYRIGLLVVFAVAMLIRMLATSVLSDLDAPPDYAAGGLDVVEYEAFAYSMSIGRGFSMPDGTPTARRAPGTSFSLLPIYWIFGRSYLGARLWLCAMSAFTCVVVAWVARPYLGAAVALVAAAWLAIYPGHLYYATLMMSEPAFGLLLVSGVGLTLRAVSFGQRERTSWIVAAVAGGLCWGMAILTRPMIGAAAPLAWLLAAISPRNRRVRLGVAAVQTLILLSVVTPWVVRNHFVMGQATIVTLAPSLAFFGAHHEKTFDKPGRLGYWTRIFSDDPKYPLSGSELEMAAASWQYGMDTIRARIDEMPKLLVFKLWRFFSPFPVAVPPLQAWIFAIGWLTAAPFVAMGVLSVYRRDPALALMLLAPVAATLAAVLVAHGAVRFREGLSPLFLIFAAQALVTLGWRYRQRIPGGEQWIPRPEGG